MSKKLLSILCVLLCLCLVLTACGNSGSKKSDSKTDKSSSSKTDDKAGTEGTDGSTGTTQTNTGNSTQQTENNNTGNSNHDPNWTEAIKPERFNNVTVAMAVEFSDREAADQPDAMTYALNGNMVKMDDGDFEENAEMAQTIRESMIGIVLKLLDTAVVTYNTADNLYTANGSACWATVMEFKAYITATEIVFTIENGNLASFSCHMVQDISSAQGEETLELDVTFTFRNYGTTGNI